MYNKIREIRTRQGISQKALARKANICQSLLCAIETERVKPGVNDMRRISRALKTDITHVFPTVLSEKKDSAESLTAPAESSDHSTNGGDSTHGD